MMPDAIVMRIAEIAGPLAKNAAILVTHAVMTDAAIRAAGRGTATTSAVRGSTK